MKWRGREVAVKIVSDGFGQDPERLARFRREAQLLASLNHPHIAAIYGFEEATLRQTLCRASKSLAASEQPDV